MADVPSGIAEAGAVGRAIALGCTPSVRCTMGPGTVAFAPSLHFLRACSGGSIARLPIVFRVCLMRCEGMNLQRVEVCLRKLRYGGLSLT